MIGPMRSRMLLGTWTPWTASALLLAVIACARPRPVLSAREAEPHAASPTQPVRATDASLGLPESEPESAEAPQEPSPSTQPASHAGASGAPNDLPRRNPQSVEETLGCSPTDIAVGEPETRHITAFLPRESWNHFWPRARCCSPPEAPNRTVCEITEERVWKPPSYVDGWSDAMVMDHLVVFAGRRLVSRRLLRFGSKGSLFGPRPDADGERRYELTLTRGEISLRTTSRTLGACVASMGRCAGASIDDDSECSRKPTAEEKRHRARALAELCRD